MDGRSARDRVADGLDRFRERPLKILKFGGTSLATADRIVRATEIIRSAVETYRIVVVASATGRTTDTLVEVIGAAGRPDRVRRLLELLRRSHVGLARAVLSARRVGEYERVLEAVLGDVETTAIAGGIGGRGRDRILAAGERLSVPLISTALCDAGVPSGPFDATALIRTDETFGSARVRESTTESLIREWYDAEARDLVGVVTGYIGSTDAGDVTTLGRGGSDYSAALIARALRADALERWTDVAGIYTDDPRTNGHARRLASIVLSEAVSWNHAGRLGMHRKALDPLMEASIPVYVRSTLEPDHPGTVIVPEGFEPKRAAV